MNSNILIIGFSDESTIQHLVSHLQLIEAQYDILDLTQILKSENFNFTYKETSLEVAINNKKYDLIDYTSFYCRFFYKETGSPSRNQGFLDLIDALTSFLNGVNKKVVNRPSAGLSNYSKMTHIIDLQQAGFSIPLSYIIGSPLFAKSLFDKDWEWVSKGCSSYRTRAEKMDGTLFISLDLLKFCPSQFQKFISGPDIRVHIIGGLVFALKIISQETDYRYDGSNSTFEEITVPETIINSCLLYCYRERLDFCGFDFKIDAASGVWYVLECNPMPGFEYFDRYLDGKIVKGLTEYLSQPYYTRFNFPDNDNFISIERRKKFH